MQLIHFQRSSQPSRGAQNSFEKNREILKELERGHSMFLEKMIPEIEQYFVYVCKGTLDQQKQKVLESFVAFSDFRLKLTDHIAMEEEIVFPFFKGLGLPNSQYTAKEFIKNHENHEAILSQLITDINADLAHLQSEMPYRMLLHKLQTLNQAFVVHGQLEDALFEEFTLE